ncbi:hypothetical protein Tco_0398130 [Tanacetum coccineum]
MTTLAEFIILSGGDNRPSMLDKDLYNSWKSIMELYMQNIEHERMILESVKHGPLIWPTIEENRVIKTNKYAKLSATEKIEADCDLKATNIILQGLPSHIYSLVNHPRVSKDLWERIQLLMQVNQQINLVEFPQIDSGLAVPVFKQGYDPIDAINKMMPFLSTVITSHFPSTNNQLRNSSNLRQQATNHDGRVTVQPLQGRPNSYVAGTSGTRANTPRIGGNNSGQQRVLKCFNCQEEGNGKVLNEEELEFLADPAKAFLMTNLSSYSSNVLSEVPYYDNTNNDMLNQSVQEMPYSEPSKFVEHPKNKIHSDSNIIPYSQYLIESQNTSVQEINSSTQQDAMILFVFKQLSHQVTNCNKINKDNLIGNESLSAELERYKERIKLIEERQNVDLGTREKLIIDDIIWDKDAQFADFERKINSLKQTIFEQLKEKETLTNTCNVLKNESKEKEAKNIDKEFALEKKVKELDNIVYKMGQSAQIKAQQIRPMLYDGNVTTKETNVISIDDSEETLMLEEESRSKMILKQSDLMVLEKKVNIKVVNYVVLNQLSEDLGKRFDPQQELSAEQAFWFQMSNPSTDSSDASPIKVDVPSKLPKVSLVNARLKKLNFHLAQFDSVVKKRITPDALTEGMYKLDPLIMAPRDNNNMETHIYYLKHTMEQAAILKEIVEQAKSLNPLDNASYTASKYINLIQELLAYVRDTCPDIDTPSKKLVVVTPINKKKIVRFTKLVASSTNIPKVTNRPSLSSTGVKPSTSASGSKPSGNTKNDRISRPPSSNEKNKVEVQSRKLKSSCLNGSVVLESGCSKHMTGDRSQLNYFIHKFIGTVKFDNDQVVKIMGYGDYHIGNVKISRVYYVE